MLQVFNKIKDVLINENKKYFIIGVVLLIACVIIWDVWSNSNVSTDGITANTVTTRLKSTGDQQQRAGQAITESKSATTAIQQSNNAIRSTNSEIESTIVNSQQLNKSSADILKRDKRILSEVRSSQQVKN